MVSIFMLKMKKKAVMTTVAAATKKMKRNSSLFQQKWKFGQVPIRGHEKQTFDGMEGDLMQAKKTMRETHEKYDETSKRIAI